MEYELKYISQLTIYLTFNFIELLESEPELGNNLLNDPENSLKYWNEAAFNSQRKLIEEDKSSKYIIKNNVTCRISSLPPWSHISFTTFPGNAHSNKFIQVSGTVTRMSAKKALEYQRQYICSKCKYPITIEASFERMNIIKAPKTCTNPNGCSSKHIITFGDLDPYNCKDYQEIKIQEDLSKPGIGSTPNHMIIILEDDLVDSCKPGENITVCGILKRRWSEFSKGDEMKIDIALKANHIQLNDKTGSADQVISDEIKDWFKTFWNKFRNEPLVGRSVILRSIAPELYGLNLVKLGVAIVLAGGTQSINESLLSTDIPTRSEPHILLVGDPGTGKSEMLRFASKIVKRSVLTTGVGSTAAGLTVSAVMEKRHWQLEAGALVMSDGGICCIDEFNSMKEHDRTSIHEAMEQQTISVAKGGIVCKLKTRCSILAACNPKGNIDSSQPLCVNVAMSSPLLSRFDLILLIKDTVNGENDKRIAQNCGSIKDKSIWKLERLQAYYAVIKTFNPKLTDDAETVLSTYYQLQRKLNSRNKSRTTMRLLESLIRLSQGHAKLMFHTEVHVLDIVFAVVLVDAALDHDSSLLSLKVSDNAFCDDPETVYQELGQTVLRKLNLEYIWQRELAKNASISERTIENEEKQTKSKRPFDNISNTQEGVSASKVKKLFPKFATKLDSFIDDNMDLNLGNIWNSKLKNPKDMVEMSSEPHNHDGITTGTPISTHSSQESSFDNNVSRNNHFTDSSQNVNSVSILASTASSSNQTDSKSNVSKNKNSLLSEPDSSSTDDTSKVQKASKSKVRTSSKKIMPSKKAEIAQQCSQDKSPVGGSSVIANKQYSLKTFTERLDMLIDDDMDNKNDTVDSGMCSNLSEFTTSHNKISSNHRIYNCESSEKNRASTQLQHNKIKDIISNNVDLKIKKSFPSFASKLNSFDDEDWDLDRPTNYNKFLSQISVDQTSTSKVLSCEKVSPANKIDNFHTIDGSRVAESSEAPTNPQNSSEKGSSGKISNKFQFINSKNIDLKNKKSFPLFSSKLDSFNDEDMDLDKPTKFKKLLSQVVLGETSTTSNIASFEKTTSADESCAFDEEKGKTLPKTKKSCLGLTTRLDSSTNDDMDFSLSDIWQSKLKRDENDPIYTEVCSKSMSNNSHISDGPRMVKNSETPTKPQDSPQQSSSIFNNNLKQKKSFPKFASKLDSFSDEDMDLDKPTNFKKLLSQVAKSHEWASNVVSEKMNKAEKKSICENDEFEDRSGSTKKLKMLDSSKKLANDLKVLENIPSVNDDFSKFNIDFDISTGDFLES